MTYNKKSIEDIDVTGKRALVRCDFNVPMKDGKITSEKRIVSALPTIQYLIDHGAKVILCSHMGKPKTEEDRQKYTLAPVAKRLSELLGKEVVFATDVTGPDADIFVNDAFGSAHRAHASTAGVADYLDVAVCGYLIQKEISIMGKALEDPKRPFVAILGGAKVSDKIGVINNLLDKVDTLIVGGGMAYTFFRALGNKTGSSICEVDKLDVANEVLKKAEEKGVNFLIPVDNEIGRTYDENTTHMTIYSDSIPDGWMGLDIGPVTRELFAKTIQGSGTVVWNGPMGVSEWKNFAAGTETVATAVAESGAVSIIGGGDSAAAIEKLGFADKMTHISTGGGASLEFLEGKELPGIACLNDR